jgi:AcrR family transcriptional regulator
MSSKPRPAPGRRARAPAADARAQLLDAAIALFAERGIANTTVAQIAAAGQVTSAMVHYWFDTREQLLDAVVQERLAPLFHRIWDTGDMERVAPLDLVRGIVQRMFDVTAEAPWLPSLWLREIVSEGGLLRERALSHIPLKRVAGFGQKMVLGQARGELSSAIAPALVFGSILALVMLPQATDKIWRRINPGLALDRQALERHVTQLLMLGINGRAGGGAGRTRNRTARNAS